MSREKIRLFADLTVCALGAAAGAYLVLRYALPVLVPFLFAWGIAFVVRPPAAACARHTSVPRRVWQVIFALLVLLLLVGTLALLVGVIATEAWRLAARLGEEGRIGIWLSAVLRFPQGLFGDTEGAAVLESRLTDAISGALSAVVGQIGAAASALIGAVPGVMLAVWISMISTVYFAYDLERVNRAVRALLPARFSVRLGSVKAGAFSVGVRYLRAYALLMLMAFAVMLFGFLILGVEYAVLIALIVAVLDALPVFGVGTVLVPWSVLAFLSGDMRSGIGLAVLYVVHEVLRQLVEPRIVGKNLGLHPLLTLVLLYAGYTLFGIGGLLVLPLACVLLQALLRRGKEASDAA